MVWELAVGDTSGHLHLAALQAPWLSLQPCLEMAVTLFFVPRPDERHLHRYADPAQTGSLPPGGVII
jgi:hypothetical protein